MAMTISARSVDGQRESPRINDLTIKGSSLLKARLKRLLDLEKELLGLHVVARAELHARAASQSQRDQRQNKSSHLLLLPAEDLKHADQRHNGGGDCAELLGVDSQPDSRGKGQQARICAFLLKARNEVFHRPHPGCQRVPPLLFLNDEWLKPSGSQHSIVIHRQRKLRAQGRPQGHAGHAIS